MSSNNSINVMLLQIVSKMPHNIFPEKLKFIRNTITIEEREA